MNIVKNMKTDKDTESCEQIAAEVFTKIIITNIAMKWKLKIRTRFAGLFLSIFCKPIYLASI